jgi:ankyrin repeat protein
LLLGALKARLEAVQRLIDLGAEVNPDGWTPLQYSMFGGSKEVTAMLDRQGCEAGRSRAKRADGLDVAVKLGKLDLVQQS